MNFLQAFQSSFDTYLTSFVPSNEGETAITFYDFVRNELRKKNIQIFTNQGKGTTLCRYKGDKSKMDWASELVRFSRSVVFDYETHQTLMVSPPKSYLLEEFKVKHPTFEGVLVEGFPSGPMVNLFHHPSKGWMISTRSYVGADNNFRSGEKSFHKLFNEALLKTTNLELEKLVDEFNKSLTYSFVLTHPDYFDVTRYANPSIVLVEVRNRGENHSLVNLSDIKSDFKGREWTINFPEQYTFATWDAVDEFIKTQPCQEQGLVFRFGEERAKVRNQEFLKARVLLGNHSKLIDIFAENLQNKTTNEFLEIFPEKMTEFEHYLEIYGLLIHQTHSYYIAHHTRPAGEKIEFSEIPRPIQTAIWNIHKQYLESGATRETRRQVKPLVVENYYKNLTAVELANVLSYWDIYLKNNPLQETTKAQTQQKVRRYVPRRV